MSGRFWGLVGPCWPILSLCWSILGPMLAHLERFWPILRLCSALELCWPNWNAFLGVCWVMFTHLDPQERKMRRSKQHCILPKPLPLSPVYFALNPFFFHCILPTMHVFVMYFAETSTPFSIVFCPRIRFSFIAFCSQCMFS